MQKEIEGCQGSQPYVCIVKGTKEVGVSTVHFYNRSICRNICSRVTRVSIWLVVCIGAVAITPISHVLSQPTFI